MIKELFPKSNLPKDGWFQSCVVCYAITADLIFFEEHTCHKETIKYYAHLCKDCKKIMKKNKKINEKYERRCNKLIADLMQTTSQAVPNVATEEEDCDVSTPRSL